MAKKTIRVSDVSGAEIPEGKGAVVRITFADARKGVRELDMTDAEAEKLLTAIHFGGDGATAGCGLDDGLLHFLLQGFVLRLGFGHQLLKIEATHRN